MITPWAFYQLSCSFILLGNILILIYYIYMTITRKMFRYYTVSKKLLHLVFARHQAARLIHDQFLFKA